MINNDFRCENMFNKGIEFMHLGYVEVNDTQEKLHEYKKIVKFLNKYIKYYSEKNGVCIKDLKLRFINYGKTQLIYILEQKNIVKETILVKQPIAPFGIVKRELDNLTKLYQIDHSVMKPMDYFSYDDQELYTTSYINQARCVASRDSWGMYVPEPYYRFEPFNEQQENIVTTCMMAKMVSFYDFESHCGIAKCKLDGGDFMLSKIWEKEELTIPNTLNNLYFIAARDTIECSFTTYIHILKDEFSRTTIGENQDNFMINLNGKVPISRENIERGIELGKTIIKNRIKYIDENFNQEEVKQLKVKKL